MFNKTKKLLLAGALALAPLVSSASVLTGDTITFSANPGVFGPVNVLVGAGIDLNADNFHFDMNGGAAGDHFTWTSTPFAGSLAGSTSITLSGLDFTDGSTLIGFFVDSTILRGLVISIVSNSLTISFTNAGTVGPGPILDGHFLTRAVPVPATALLLLTGLGLVGAFRRKTGARQ